MTERTARGAPSSDPSHADGRALFRRGLAALQTGAVDEALKELEAAYDQAVSQRDRLLEAEALVELARALKTRGTLDQAVLCLERAVEASKAAAAPRVQAEAHFLDAELRRKLGDPTRARHRLEDASRLFDEAYAAARAAKDSETALEIAERARLVRDQILGASPAAGTTVERGRAADNARREESQRIRQRAVLETLYETSRRLVEERDPDRVVASVLDGAIEATGAERGFVLLSPDEGAEPDAQSAEDERRRDLPGGLRVAAARNFDRAEVRRPEFKVSRTVIERALASGKPVVVRDASIDAQLAEHSSVIEHKLRSIACAPIRSQRPSGVHGVLYLDNRFGEGAFAEGDLPALAAFAAHAGVAVENARLHAQAARERRALEKARARAEDLAQRLEVELTRTGDELGKVRARLDETQSALALRSGMGDIVGRSHAMQSVYKLLEKLKESDVPALVRGESGTGKELVARAIHFEGHRKNGPYVSENCAAIPETLLESTLFGHEPGAFTGAVKRQAGLFELASGGTLFLDEIGELTPSCQAKLLRVLEERKVRRIGGSDAIAVDVRIICATNRDREAMVKDGELREDLWFRLNVVQVRLPPLRERRDDIPILLEKFLEKNAAQARPGAGPPSLSPEALRALLNYSWPGNVRELENEVKRILALKGDRIGPDDLSPEIHAGASAGAGLPRASAPGEDAAPITLDEAERRAVLAALKIARGNKARAAEILAIPRTSLYHKLRHHRIADDELS
ncbi:sigma-54-dependent Fis family transcriptional regulator [bacterium]|nr:sigma-54-dependent Fis family transcriptional regulator [bacterium]